MLQCQGSAETFGGAGGQVLKGHINTAFNRAVLFADMCRNGCFCIDTAANAMTQV